MPYQVKIIFTVAILAITIAVLFINPNLNNAGPDWFWRLGRSDPVRNLLCRQDGTLLRHAKMGILAWFVVFLTVIWLVA
jgi:hypothetical protein